MTNACLMALIKGPPNFVGSLVEWWKPCPLVVGCLWRRCNCRTLIASGCWVDLRIMKPKMCTFGFHQMFCIPWLFRVVFWLVLGGTPSFPCFFSDMFVWKFAISTQQVWEVSCCGSTRVITSSVLWRYLYQTLSNWNAYVCQTLNDLSLDRYSVALGVIRKMTLCFNFPGDSINFWEWYIMVPENCAMRRWLNIPT